MNVETARVQEIGSWVQSCGEVRICLKAAEAAEVRGVGGARVAVWATSKRGPGRWKLLRPQWFPLPVVTLTMVES